MKKYWFYLEPYVFVFEGRQGAIIYNTLSSSVVFVCSEVVLPLVHELNLANNGYCIELTEKQIQEDNMASFIKDIRDKFSGDIVLAEEIRKKPFILKPALNLVYDPNKFEKNLGKTLDENLLHYLHAITLYLDYSCKNECSYCQKCYKQFLFCTKEEEVTESSLSIEDYSELINTLNIIGLKTINLVVNNFSNYGLFWHIIDLLKDSRFTINIFTHYLNIDRKVLDWSENQENIHFVVLSDANIPEEIISSLSIVSAQLVWKFLVCSDEEYSKISQLKDKYGISIDLSPFFNGNNEEFFSDNVYTDLEDLFVRPISKKEIFTRQSLNTNLFGKLSIMPDGEVYSNMATSSLGNLKKDTLNNLIFNEFSNKKSWLFTRDKEPCLYCVYRYLCPSPSNYELILGRDNLCHIK